MTARSDPRISDPGRPADQWAAALARWAIPDEILARAPESPWAHPPALFTVDPGADTLDTPSHRLAREALASGGTVLDVGCGGGASSVPLAPAVTRVTGVDEQPAMLDNFAHAWDTLGVPHLEVQGRWPDVAGAVEPADVVVCHHVVYNVADIEPFVQALTEHAQRRVVVELPERHPTSPLNPLWLRFWGLERPSEPSAELFVEIVRALGLTPVVELAQRPPRKARIDRAEYVAFVRRRLCLTPDRDPEVDEALGDTEATVGAIATVAWSP